MMSTIKITVIIPAYNVEAYVEDSIRSICRQTLADTEIIVVDDCSTDGTLGVIEKCAAEDTRIHIIRNEVNMGQSSSRNKALDAARGEYVQFLDGDDMLEEDALRQVYEKISSEQADIVFYDMTNLFETEELRNTWVPKLKRAQLSRLYDNCSGVSYLTQTLPANDWRGMVTRCMFRRSFLEVNGLRFPEGRIHEDDSFSFCSILLAERVCNMRGDFYIRRFRDGSTMTNPDYAKKFISRYGNTIDMGAAADRLLAEKELTEEERDAVISVVNKQAKSMLSCYVRLSEEEKDELQLNGAAANAFLYASRVYADKSRAKHEAREKALSEKLGKSQNRTMRKIRRKMSGIKKKLLND